MKVANLVSALIALLMLSGCMTTVPTASKLPVYSETTTEQETAKVVVYRRKRFYQALATFPLTVDGQLAGYLTNGSYMELSVRPGKRTIAIKRDRWRNYYMTSDIELEIEVKEHPAHYLETGYGKVTPEYFGAGVGLPFIFTANGFLIQMTKETARENLVELKPVGLIGQASEY